MSKIEKLKKIHRFLFPKIYSPSELFVQKIKRNKEISFFEKQNESYLLRLQNGLTLNVRDENHSDFLVFEQIFNYKEYEIVLGLITLNQFSNEQAIIIDAGANVGFTSVFFASNMPLSKILAIEPSSENAAMFRINVSYLENSSNIKLYQNALSKNKGMHYTINRDFRDGRDWSIKTELNLNGDIKGITIDEIINENKLEYITLLKIDIEGAERFLFDVENDLSFLKITKFIAIEIHDEYNIREYIYKILKENNFILMESGELTIAINKTYF